MSQSDPAQLQAIYQELILDHYRRPRNKGMLEGADVSVDMRNPFCGDEITLQVAFEGDTVRDVRFAGRGCSISQASASIMTGLLKGKTRAEVEELRERVRRMMQGDAEVARDKSLGDLRALAGVAKFPARVKCALLAWDAAGQVASQEPETGDPGPERQG